MDGGCAGGCCQGKVGGIGNGAALDTSGAGVALGAGCNAGAIDMVKADAEAAGCVGTAGAGKLGGLSEVAWLVADAAVVFIAGGVVQDWRTGRCQCACHV